MSEQGPAPQQQPKKYPDDYWKVETKRLATLNIDCIIHAWVQEDGSDVLVKKSFGPKPGKLAPADQKERPIDAFSKIVTSIAKLDPVKYPDLVVKRTRPGHSMWLSRGVAVKCQDVKNKDTFEIYTGQPMVTVIKESEIDRTDTTALGAGTYAQVWKGIWNKPVVRDGAPAIVRKKIAEKQFKQRHGQGVYAMLRELNIAYSIRHKAICRIYGITFRTPAAGALNQGPSLIMPYIEKGTLSSLIKGSGMTMTQRYIILYGLACGLAHLHERKIIHRDFKPDNVLLTEQLYPKICDLGMAKVVDVVQTTGNVMMTASQQGSPGFIAPEYGLEVADAEKLDVYSYGMTIWATLEGTDCPWPGKDAKAVATIVKEEGRRPKLTAWKETKLAELMNMCWDADPNNRPTMQKVKEMLENEEWMNLLKVDVKKFREYQQYLSGVDTVKGRIKKAANLIHSGEFNTGRDALKEIIAELGDGDSTAKNRAYLVLGELYENEDYPEYSFRKAYKFYRGAARGNSLEGYQNLARCYEFGIGVAADPLIAAVLEEKAAELRG